MSEQGEMLVKLSKSQKKKKAAQKKKLAKKIDKANEELEAIERAGRVCDEIDARVVESFNNKAMRTRDFQMLNLRGKLLVHPSQSFIEAMTDLRQIMGRDTYPHRISHAQRLYHLGVGGVPLPSWSVAMGTASYIPINRFLLDSKEHSLGSKSPKGSDGEGKVAMFRFAEPVQHGRKGSFTDQTYGALGLMVWYPIMSMCMNAGDMLACIALRDSCVLLRTCYGLFRNDITRLEQYVFDTKNPDIVKQLDWVARRVEVPPSPPQTPPRFGGEVAPSGPTEANTLLAKDPFRAPIVVTKRWSDYDDDDESLGSPMSLPITPESSFDVPVLDLAGSSDGSEATGNHLKESLRRAPTIVTAIPTLARSGPWFSTDKTILPVPRISILTFEDYPRSNRASSSHPMKLQSSAPKHVPGATGDKRVRMRVEHWVREDTEKKLKARLALSSVAKRKADADAEIIVYNRAAALAGLNTGETVYIGEPDILGSGLGICVDDVREIVVGRFREKTEKSSSESAEETSPSDWSKVMLVPSAEGWICKQLGQFQS